MIQKMLIVPISAVAIVGCVSPLEDPNPFVRGGAVSALTNQVELIRFVRNDADLSVRKTALRKVESQEVLTGFIRDKAFPIELKMIAAERLTDEEYVNRIALVQGIDVKTRLVLVEKVQDEKVLLKLVKDWSERKEVRDAAANRLTHQEYIDEAVKSYQNEYLIHKTTDLDRVGQYLANQDVIDSELLKKITDPIVIRKMMTKSPECKRLVAKVTDNQEILGELLVEAYKDGSGKHRKVRVGGGNSRKLCEELILKISDETKFVPLLDLKPDDEILECVVERANSEDILLRAFLASDSPILERKILEKNLSDKCRLSMLSRLGEKKRSGDSIRWNMRKSKLVNLIGSKITDQDSIVEAVLSQYEFRVADNNVMYSIDSSIRRLSDRLDEEHKKKLNEKRQEKISSMVAVLEKPVLEKASGGDLSSIIELAKAAASRRDYKEALRWREKAAEKGHFDSMWRCGNYYFNGWGVNKDLDKALDFYERSAKFQYEPAIASMNEVHYVKSHPDIRVGDEIDQFTIPRLKPEEKGFYYTYAGGEGFEKLRVIQSLPAKGIVLVKPAVDYGSEDMTEKKGVLCVFTKKEYVKDEYLRAGIFEYSGLYTYKTALGMRTVRSFKEWVAK